MIKTATNIIKGALRHKKSSPHNFKPIGWFREKWLKHQEDKKIKRIHLDSLLVFYKRPYELLHSYKEIFQNEIYCFTTNTKIPVIIDCGSNIGLSVLYFKKIYPEAKVIAFEPDPGNFALLKQNVEMNQFAKVELNKAAVWIYDGEISFASKGSEASHISPNGDKEKVSAISLKKILDQYPEIDFLKIDIEGAEDYVIEDIKLSLDKVKNLFLEYHGKAEETLKLNKLLAIIHNNGFKVYIRNAADNLKKPFVEKTTGTIYDIQLNLFCYK